MPPQQTNVTSETGRDDPIAYHLPALGQDEVRHNLILANLARFARGLAQSFLWRYWSALQERRQRQRLRAALRYLSDRELMDIGIARDEIDYIASQRGIDLRRDSTTTLLWIVSRGVP
jgi:uncharacterized protein YjiS (DUF1127 family)